MFKVILVDDERWALVDILHTFPFDRYGFTVVGQFTSAVQALERAPELRPDVLFADIRMPSLSGLDLIHLLRDRLPDMEAILLSGYAEFTYAQNAIRLDVYEYCLKPMDEAEADALLSRLAAHLKRRAEPRISDPIPDDLLQSACGNQHFAELLRYTNEHVYEKLVLDELARRFYLNPSYCGQLFRTVTGKTFSQYVRDARMDRACELLKHSQLPVYEVAACVGYEDIHYFTRVFTGHMGVSPRQYRRRK